MKSKAIILCSLCLLAGACAPLNFVKKPTPTATIPTEPGTPPSNQNGKVNLAWDPVQSTATNTLLGYKLYWGTQSKTYTNSLDVGNITTATISGLVKGQIYYFAVTAYDTNQLQSEYSNEVNKSVAEIPFIAK